MESVVVRCAGERVEHGEPVLVVNGASSPYRGLGSSVVYEVRKRERSGRRVRSSPVVVRERSSVGLYLTVLVRTVHRCSPGKVLADPERSVGN